ncbi:nodulation protein NodN [Oleiphilus sp. HI0071]|uniref:MaoC family dehydratase n=1 Tax=unclassified Oleiphilus TaxID=2631174 RepID=UPI0007C30F4A|nr:MULTISPECIES: MaoC family dehydratase [unclassified Oleiphilus]KZY74906.1 nodulation protein NodN [Oleiphilus sp. HI0065]KZY82011.1 nodulation protein NodN [Oleiphilus sp. HI0071]KZY89103.1 nodulation protein NodN [Oleiphilus sp. HI0073]KZZ42163.1 nodulation protein NodN [Oleiphilus sp. HI0118]KZZ50255.1 nodulation protein NodN [Oleiphilus sp. HI0122]KZZ64806.1 nodulation protein NodN [Oleiphilus sp. HI0130]KZZ81177.1 nodulation protein NodN [Oleiphilus sp. HI0133]
MHIITKEEMKQQIDRTFMSDWFEVTQDRINQFADCTLDHQFIHVDPQRAAETEFGTTIAHGFLSLSMLSHFAESFGTMIEGTYMGINFGFDKIRFISPVKVNSRIRAVATLKSITEKRPGQFQFLTHIKVEIEGSEKPALLADWLTMQLVK